MEKGQQEIEPPITVGEVREAGLCVTGQREFARERGIDFKEFVKNGMPVAEAMAMNPATTSSILARRERKRNG